MSKSKTIEHECTGQQRHTLDLAVTLKRDIDALELQLEEKKQELRELALNVGGGMNSVLLTGGTGTASVITPASKWQPKKGVDLLAMLRDQHPTMCKLAHFKEVVELDANTPAILATLTRAERAAALAHLEECFHSPRVTLKAYPRSE